MYYYLFSILQNTIKYFITFTINEVYF